MNKLALTLLLSPLALLAVPAAAEAQSFQVSVGVAPPPVRVEARPAMPAPGHVWVDGNWQWAGGQYVWQAGHWELPPYTDATWVAPSWTQTGRQWGFRPGMWRRGTMMQTARPYYAPRPVYVAPQPVYVAPRPYYNAPRPYYNTARPGYGYSRPVVIAPNAQPAYVGRPVYNAPGRPVVYNNQYGGNGRWHR